MRALFDDDEVVDLSKPVPNFSELDGNEFAKKRTHADVGEIIAASSNFRAIAGIVTVFRMIERLVHEPGERLWAARQDVFSNHCDESGIAGAHSLNPSAYVKNYPAPGKSLNR